MPKILRSLVLLLPLALAAGASGADAVNEAFEVEGTLLSYYRDTPNDAWLLNVRVGKDVLEIAADTPRPDLPPSFRPNDLVRVRGVLRPSDGGTSPRYTTVTLLARRPLGPEADAGPDEFFAPGGLGRLVRLTGLVREAFVDESDPHYVYLTMICRGEPLHAMVATLGGPIVDPDDLIGAKLAACGVCLDARETLHRYAGRILYVTGFENLEILDSPAAVTDALPALDELSAVPPSDFPRLGRHRVSGTVRAVWHGDSALLETDGGMIVGLRFRKGAPPACGARVCAVGFPETDLYFINLLHAVWSPEAKPATPEREPEEVTAKRLLTNATGQRKIDIATHGKPIRIRGVIRFLPPAGPDPDARFYVDFGGHLVPVDVSARPALLDGLEDGCTVSVTGTYVVETRNWSEEGGAPRATGFFLVPRGPSDVAVLARPSRWTPRRLLAVIGTLAALLALILAWNVALRRRAERRGRELADERLGHVTSELKVEERTRLAVELHDALSQTLTGISLEVGTAGELAQDSGPLLRRHLDFASRAIDSCRAELKNCLWDLRSEALEEEDFNRAIRRTLCQNLGDERLSVRFAVPRERLSDTAAHAILRTIRELVANAVHHGNAAHIRVAGSIEGNRLLFSVRDDGCGFDPENCPGVSEGHFGLEGIRERIAQFGGRITIVSAPGKGTKATVALDVPTEEEG